jgi:hypothetical protein
MEIEKLKRQTISRLKQVKSERGLSISKIMDLLDAKGIYVSEATVKRVFSEGSEEMNFRYQDSVAPIADVLLDLYGVSSGIQDAEALRQIIRDKNKTIEMLILRIEEMKTTYERSTEHLKDQIKRLNERLDYRDKWIDRKGALIERLLDSTID